MRFNLYKPRRSLEPVVLATLLSKDGRYKVEGFRWSNRTSKQSILRSETSKLQPAFLYSCVQSLRYASMAFRVTPKFESTAKGTYKHPHFEQYDYKYYHPQLFTNTMHHYEPDKGTKKFFNDYRRCHVSEQTLKMNMERMQTPARPTWYSDKPDRALGRRKIDREALFPVIHNKPLYKLSNRIPDRERDRDEKFMCDVLEHRLQYKDLTGSRHVKSSHFHCPNPASDVFIQKKDKGGIYNEYPSNFRVAQESVYNLKRASPLVNFMENDVY